MRLVPALLMVVGAACAPSPEPGPIDDSTMVNVLVELHLVVGRAEVANDVPPNIRDSILTAYDVDSTTYAHAVTYYAAHPEKYEEIYTRVLDRLNSERFPRDQSTGDGATSAPPTRSPR